MLTGTAMKYDILCHECAGSEEPVSHLIEVCVGCFDRADEWTNGWRGAPEILVRDKEIAGTWRTRPCTVEPVNARCLAPLPGGWLAYTAEGLVEIDAGGEHLLGPIALPEDTSDGPPETWGGRKRGPALYTSPDGRFAAIVSDYGRYGTVVDLPEWATVLDLERDRDDVEFTRYPFAFIGRGDSAKVVAGTDWNRLDVFELPDGHLLTDRVTSYERGEAPPEHYLDYFQGAVLPNPSERLLVVDGWAWHPVGAPMVVDAEAWLQGDVHAAEDGDHLRSPTGAWDQPIAWVDDDTVAIQRIGNDDERMLEGIELYEARSTRRIRVFAGPSGPMWAYRGLLYVAAKGGFEIWDPAEGARIGLHEGFTPTAHRDGVFAELGNGQLRIWTSTR
jgi:hypothetical protein